MRGNESWVTALVIAAFGCGGEVQPLGDARGGAGGSGGGSSFAGGGASQAVQNSLASCETECFRQIVSGSPVGCKLCHGTTVKLEGNLDLESPGISARLKDAPAEHTAVGAGAICPMGDKLIDSANPESSWLLRKILGQQNSCGTQMPSTGMLSAPDQQCMVAYVNCVASR